MNRLNWHFAKHDTSFDRPIFKSAAATAVVGSHNAMCTTVSKNMADDNKLN